MPLEAMRASPELVAVTVAEAAFGSVGGSAVNALMWVSIFGALGGLVMALPRLFYATASDYADKASNTLLAPVFRRLSYVSPRSSVPAGSILYAAGAAILALLFFGSFSKIVSFILVPLQFINILLVLSVYKLRPRLGNSETFRTPGYPVVPAIFVAVMSIFLFSALLYNPLDSLIGIGLTLLAVPAYRLLAKSVGNQARP